MATFQEHLKEVRDLSLNRLLGAKTIPNPLFTEEELADCYQGLTHFLETKYDRSQLHQNHAKNNWQILEFQSSWHVLWQYLPTEEIETFSEEKRLQTYQQKLEENQENFPHLHPQRKKAQQTLEELARL